MSRKPLPSISVLWKRYELIYTEIFIIALQKLSQETCDVSNEDAISEALCPILTQVCYSEGQKRHCEIRTPDWEKAIQPVLSSELKGGKRRKRPDFTCKLINPLASSAEEYELPLHIECKRLGAPSSANWILNENYVVNGIMRFDSKDHEYGKRAFSGLMIGYIVNMLPHEIIAEIDEYFLKYFKETANITYQSCNEEVTQYRQYMKRRCVQPEAFDIVHLWVKLRETFHS